jgi:hypothetical protein
MNKSGRKQDIYLRNLRNIVVITMNESINQTKLIKSDRCPHIHLSYGIVIYMSIHIK